MYLTILAIKDPQCVSPCTIWGNLVLWMNLKAEKMKRRGVLNGKKGEKCCR